MCTERARRRTSTTSRVAATGVRATRHPTDTIHGTACKLQTMTDLGHEAWGRIIARSTSKIYDCLRAKIENFRTETEARVRLRTDVHTEGCIKKERRNSHFTAMLKDLKQDGWGWAAMQEQLPKTTVMHDVVDDGTTTTRRSATRQRQDSECKPRYTVLLFLVRRSRRGGWHVRRGRCNANVRPHGVTMYPYPWRRRAQRMQTMDGAAEHALRQTC